MVEFDFMPWVTPLECLNLTLASQRTQLSRVSIYTSSSYIDFNNIEEPFQTNYRYNQVFLIPSEHLETWYNVRSNKYTLQDSI